MNNFCKLGIKKIFFLIKNKKISYTEIIEICLKNLQKLKKKNNFIIKVFKKESLKIAKFLDKTIPKVLSIPVSIKNIFNLKNKKLSCNSKILKNFVSTYDSNIIKIFKKYNIILICLDNLEEFCIGSSGLNNCLNIKNTYNKNFFVGGSTSGSAITLSNNCTVGSIGSDTGGSIRSPSSYLNLVGFKPTYGKISRHGMIHYSSCLDSCSIMTNYSIDCKFLFNILNSKNLDLSSFNKFVHIKYEKIKITVLYFNNLYVDYELKRIFEKVILNFKTLNYSIIFKKIDLSNLFYEYEILSSIEFYSNSCKFDGIKFGYNSSYFKNINNYIKNNRIFYNSCKNKILLGKNNFFLKKNFKKIDLKILNFFNNLFLNSDLLIIPMHKNIKINKKNYSEYFDYLTVFSNLIGYPSISIPIGKINHLPIGFQIIGELNSDNLVLETAINYEKSFLNKNVSF